MRLRVRTQRGDVIERGGEPDGAGDVRRSRLEAAGNAAVRRSREIDRLDHVAAALIRRHFFQNLRAPVKHADARRPADFVPGKNEEIAADVLHVEREMRGRLRRVHQRQRARCMRQRANFLHGIDRAERVGDMNGADDFRARRNLFRERLHVQRAVVENRRDDEPRSRARGDELPRHDVGVVLHVRDQNFVALAQIRAAPARGDEVDRLRRAAREHAFPRLARADERRGAFPRVFERGRRRLAQMIKPAVNVRVFLGIKPGNGIDDALRFLRRGGAVEIRETGISAQQREIRPDFFDVERHRAKI